MRSSRDERGAVVIMVAVLATVLFMLAALVVDLGLARDNHRQSQDAADASALAAANALYPDSGACTSPAGAVPPCFSDAVAAAKSYAAANFGVTDANWSDCTDSAPLAYEPDATSCITFDDSAGPRRARVVVPTREVQTGFAAAIGVSDIPISTSAGAAVDDGVTVDCGLCFLGDVDSGNADYTVEGGSIAVSGNISIGSTGHVTATGAGSQVAIGGSFNQNDDGFSPQPLKVVPFDDPLAGLDLPAGDAGLTPQDQPCETTKKGVTVSGDGPGVYGDVSLDGTCALEPGLYIITGTWSLKNNDLLTSKPGGVTLYFTCGATSAVRECVSGDVGGKLEGKNGEVDLAASTAGPLPGFAIVYDRDNRATLQLQGNGRLRVSGAVYAKSSALDYNGNSCFMVDGGPVVVDSVIKANGTKSCVTVANSRNATVAELPGGIYLDQ